MPQTHPKTFKNVAIASSARGSIPICSIIFLEVEIEQRHLECDISEIFNTILELKYEGFFLIQGKLIKLNEFTYEKYQKPFLNNVSSKEYVNNFIFIPKSKLSALLKDQ